MAYYRDIKITRKMQNFENKIKISKYFVKYTKYRKSKTPILPKTMKTYKKI